MIIQILLLITGLAMLIVGADWLVGGASTLAKKFNISDLTIGLTVVAFGTSAPELVVNLFAATAEHQDLVFGNILGSNNFNIFIVLGVSGLILPLRVHLSTIWKEIPISFAAIVIFFLMVLDPFTPGKQLLGRIDGLILVLLFILFQYYVYRQMKRSVPEHLPAKPATPVIRIVGLILLGLAGLVIGGRMVVSNAVVLAKAIGISEKVIGITIVAAGTSLPELATSVVAVLKKNTDIAVGNIIGSNIFNIFLIGGLVSVVKPVAYSTSFNNDFYILAAGTVILFINMFTFKRHKLDRWEAALLLVFYIGYTVLLITEKV